VPSTTHDPTPPDSGPALWRHFTSAGHHAHSTVITRAQGCHFWDDSGRRYLDGLAGLHSVNIGYGPWPEIVEAARTTLETLPFFPNWFGFANEPALALADRLREIAPLDAGHVFFAQSGSEAVEAAMKVARQFHRLSGDPHRTKFVTRRGAYHGTTMGALSLNGGAVLRNQFEPLLAGVARVAPTYPLRCVHCAGTCGLGCADEIETAILSEGPETVAAVVLEPLQNSGGALVPPPGYPERVREICDRHGVLLVLDETITGFGRVGEWFGATRYGFVPDIVTTAKGLASSWAPIGAMIASARVSEPFFAQADRTFLHGSTFGGHPVSASIALANLAIIEREGLVEKVRRDGELLRSMCEELVARHPLLAEVRGDGYFLALEIVRDRETKTPFPPQERARLIRDVLLPQSRAAGVHVKFDDRIELAALLTPPLVAGPEEFEQLIAALEQTLDAALAWTRTEVAA
jgi:adenosylmethionine-8-amino-7-oxononanoate aminotransferase